MHTIPVNRFFCHNSVMAQRPLVALLCKPMAATHVISHGTAMARHMDALPWTFITPPWAAVAGLPFHVFHLQYSSSTRTTIFFPPIPFIIFALLFSLPSSRNSDPGSHGRLFSPPPHYGMRHAFLSRQDFSSFFTRRLASNCAYPR